METIARKFWDLTWMIPHNIRAVPCFLLRKHLGKRWFMIETIHENGDGFCSICGCGAHSEDYFN